MLDWNQVRIDLHDAFVATGLSDAEASYQVDKVMENEWVAKAYDPIDGKYKLVDKFYDPEAEWNVR